MTTLAWCAASERAMAFPMPLLPPVTMATLPVRLMECSLVPVLAGRDGVCRSAGPGRWLRGGSGAGVDAGRHRRRVRCGQVGRGDDQTQVGERLREVADQALGRGVVLLRQHPHVVLEGPELLEQREGLVPSADQ